MYTNAVVVYCLCAGYLNVDHWVVRSFVRSLTIKFLKQLFRMHSFRLLNHKHLSTPMASSLAVDVVNIYIYMNAK